MKIIFFCLIFLGINCWSKAETSWFNGSDYPPLPAGKSAAGLGDYPPPRTPATPPPLYPNASWSSSAPAPTESLTPIFPGFPGYNGALALPGIAPGLATSDSIPMPATPFLDNSLNNALNNAGNGSATGSFGNAFNNPLNSSANTSLIENPATAAGSYRLPVLPMPSAPDYGVASSENSLQSQLAGAWQSNAGDQLWIQGNYFQLSSPPRTLDSATASGWQPRVLTGEVRYLPQNQLIIRSQGIELQYKIYLDGQSFIAEDQNGIRLLFERVWFTP